MRFVLNTLAGLTFVAASAVSTTARADASSWLAFGGGYALERNAVTGNSDSAGVFSATLGVGTSPRASVVVGGVFRTVTYFGLGTDISLGPRLATGGFARGQWGAAFDATVVGRFWNGGDYGRFPVQPVLTFGAPWGVQLGVAGQLLTLDGGEKAVGVLAVLELDLLRLTVMRHGATDSLWYNAAPAGGRDITPPRRDP